MKILDFYRRLLETLDVTVDDNDKLLYAGDTPVPVKYNHPVKGNVSGELYLPTRNVMKMKESVEVVKFHPTGESCLRQPSEIYKRLERLIIVKINSKFDQAAKLIFDVSRHTDCHSSISMEAVDLIAGSSGVYKEQHVKYFERIQKCITESLTDKTGDINGALSLEMIRNKSLNGTRFNRIMVVKNNLLDELEKEEPFDIRSPKKTLPDQVKSIYNTILDFDIAHGTNCRRCPNLEVLLATYGELVIHFNKIFRAFEDVRDVEGVLADESWIKEVKHLAKMHSRDLDLEFPGNIGVANDAGEQKLIKAEAIRKNIISGDDEEDDSEPSEETAAMRRRMERAKRALTRTEEAPKPQYQTTTSERQPQQQAPWNVPPIHSAQPPQQPQEDDSAEAKLMRASMRRNPYQGQMPPQQMQYHDPRYAQQPQYAPQSYGMAPPPQPPQYGYPQNSYPDPRYGMAPPPQPPQYGYPQNSYPDPRYAQPPRERTTPGTYSQSVPFIP